MDDQSIAQEELDDAARGLHILHRSIKASLEAHTEKLVHIPSPDYNKYLEKFHAVKARRELLQEIEDLIKKGSEALL